VFDPEKLSPIGIKERDQWLACMNQAMVETGVDEALRARLNTSFFQTADWMRNKGEWGPVEICYLFSSCLRPYS
jgi:truncated hemoglobin YjbI